MSVVNAGPRYCSSGLVGKFDWGVLGPNLVEHRGEAKKKKKSLLCFSDYEFSV